MGLTAPAETPGSAVQAEAVCAVCDTFDIELCAVLDHRCDIVGHAFIAIDGMAEDGSKTGDKTIVGFYPLTEQDPLSIMTEGSGRVVAAPGTVKDDSRYYKRSTGLYADRLWTLQQPQARAAHQFIASRQETPGQYSLWSRQCNNFALDVLIRAGIPTAEFTPRSGPVRPSFTYVQLSGRHVPAADWPPTECLPVTRELHEAGRNLRDLRDEAVREIGRWNNPQNWINRRW